MPTQRPPALRPLRIGEILDVAINIYRANARTLVASVAVFVVPLQILQILIRSSALTATTDPFRLSRAGEVSQVNSDFWLSMAGTLVGAVVLGVGGLLATAACFKAVSDTYLGRTPTRRTSVQFALKRLRPVLWLTAIIYFFSSLAAVPLLLPGVWLWVSWVVATPALLLEDVRGVRALGRSFKLVRRRWWPTFATYGLSLLLGTIVQSFFGGIVLAVLFFARDSEMLNLIVGGIVGIAGSLLVVPFTAAVITTIYIDLRVRKEGFDLELMAERIGVTLPEDAQPPPFLGASGQRGTPVDPHGPTQPSAGDAPTSWPPPPEWSPGPGR